MVNPRCGYRAAPTCRIRHADSKPKKLRARPSRTSWSSTRERPLNERATIRPTSIINELRQQVDQWRELKNPSQWQVTPETARLLEHWRNHKFSSVRPFFCQVEAAETAIWLTEVAPASGQSREAFGWIIFRMPAGRQSELMRLRVKLATGAGKTTVMAMLIAWQTVNAVRRPNSKNFSRGFLVVCARSDDLRTVSAFCNQTTRIATTPAVSWCPKICSTT